MKKTANQKAIDNRANQLNPNNPAYYKSRMGNKPKKNNYDNKRNTRNNQKTVVVHHHHNHVVPNVGGPQTRVCPICGAVGNVEFLRNGCGRFGILTGTGIGSKTYLKCNSCGGTFHIKRKNF